MKPAARRCYFGVAQVVPLLKLHHLGDRFFDYSIPAGLATRVGVGSVVGVPFGGRRVRGVVVGLVQQSSKDNVELRPLESVEEQGIAEGLLTLAREVAHRYVAPLESCLRLVAPPVPSGGGDKRGPTGRKWAYRVAPPETDVAAPIDDYGARGLVLHGDGRPLTAKQQALLAAVPEEGVAVRVACEEARTGKAVLDGLVRRGLVRLGPSSPRREGFGPPDGSGEGAAGPMLSREQEQAVEQLSADYQKPGLVCRQLWGVTGSGKTEVYLRLAELALAGGAGAILLVPEIALTPLMIERVQRRLGDAVGVLHSGLAASQRRREYERIAAGEARVVVGARSAVFAPVARLRLVIIDESHDGSYKQEEAPAYHTRTVAELRLRDQGGLLLEGSASPAVESMLDMPRCIRLSQRPRGALPTCEVVDMRRQSGGGVLAAATREALAQTLRNGEQAIVLLNRRGYSAYVHCDDCGHVMMCEDCELSLTYHSQAQRLLCHHCGRAYVQPPVCPSCGMAPLVRGVPGTEHLAEELGKLLPEERVFRLDSDVLTSGTRARTILEEFAASHPAMLVGTQMVAKGHDFPDVSLVVVADADTGLYAPDFRASERTFQLLTQVAGRAGRAGRPGRVLVQTWNPDVPCIRMALERDERAFYLRELGIRERLGYPPFTQLVRLVIVGEQARRVELAAQHLAERLGPHFGALEVRGPARLQTLRGKSRWHLLVSSSDGERARAIAAQAIAQLREPYRRRGVGLLVDVDPYSFF